jgi:hypothetical protein
VQKVVGPFVVTCEVQHFVQFFNVKGTCWGQKKRVETLQSFIKKTHPRLGKYIKVKEKQEITGRQAGSK